MRDDYQFTVRVQGPGLQPITTGFIVSAWLAETAGSRPYDLCGDALTAGLAGGVTSGQALRIDAKREVLAAQISARLTAAIVAAIKAQDRKNGRPAPERFCAINGCRTAAECGYAGECLKPAPNNRSEPTARTEP